jgi:uncharacterized membrane protein YeaQ/YmgE (transglycosylase-associated protein family)
MTVFEPSSLIVLLLVGLVAGWLAGKIVQGTGFGIVGDMVVGVVGAFFGTWLLARFGIFIGGGMIAAIINATIGAIVLLLIIDHCDGSDLRLKQRNYRRRTRRMTMFAAFSLAYDATQHHVKQIDRCSRPKSADLFSKNF